MIPKNIRKEHIVQAIAEIDKNGVPPDRESTKFQLSYNNKFYPPKYVISLANKYASGNELLPSEFSGGQESNGFLIRLGFIIVGPQVSVPPSPPVIDKSKGHGERCSECKNMSL